jgi:hypothetical protein
MRSRSRGGVVGLLGILLLAMLCGSGCGRQATRLTGVWEMTRANGQLVQDETFRKVVTGKHFTIVHLEMDGTAEAAGGEYMLEEGVYTERIDYHWMAGLLGRTLAFDCRLEGDLWYHSGEFSAGGRQIRVDEVWRRIE